MHEKIYLNGELVSINQATVSVSNPAFLHGVGLFETLRAYNGKPFKLAEHVERLKRSATHFNMPIGDVADKIPAAVQQVLDANQFANARVRITVTPPGSLNEPHEITLLVRGEETQGYPAELYEKGMSVCVVSKYRQSKLDPLAGHKTTSYFPRLVVLRDAQDRHCGEALWFTPENLLAEGCMSNVFMVKDGKIKTPPLDTPILPGVTRATAIELAKKENIPVEETPCTIDDLLSADEVFLTNAVMEIMPVSYIEKHIVGTGKIGEIARRLGETYRMM